MKLYHFTSISYMKAIMSEGLTKGEMPVTVSRSVNAVNLTTDKTGVGHGLCKAKFATPDFLKGRKIRLGPRDQVPMFPNKYKVRITIDLDRSRVTKWMRWAKSNIASYAMKELIASGGGMAKARTWYFANGPICPTEFESVEVRQDGGWVDILDYEGPWEETISDKILMDGYAHWGRRLLTGLPKELGARLEELIEHQDYIDQVKADAAEEATWPEAARRPDPNTRVMLMDKLSSRSDKQRLGRLDHPHCPPCLPPAVNTEVGRTDVSNVEAG